MIMNDIPENMQFLFKNPDTHVTREDVASFRRMAQRAERLRKNNGAIIPGQFTARVFWIEYAYKHNIQLNKCAMMETAHDLASVYIPNSYD